MDREEDMFEKDVRQIELILKGSKSPRMCGPASDSDAKKTEQGYADLVVSDDTAILQGTSDMEDPLTASLNLNKAYQEVLTKHIADIKKLVQRNKARQVKAVMEIQGKVESVKKKDTDLNLFHWPYFKDESGFGPPRNKDGILRDSCFVPLELPQFWRVGHESKMLETLTQQIQLKCLKDLSLRRRKIKESGEKIGEFGESLEDLDDALRATREDFSLVDLTEDDIINNADWLSISNDELGGDHSAEDCKAMFRTICNPAINRTMWSTEEDRKLVELVGLYGHQNWQKIAEELETGRSPYLCLQRYQSTLNTMATTTWTPELVEKLQQVVTCNLFAHYRNDWYRIATEVGQMVTPQECRLKYESMAKPLLWTHSEDRKLQAAVAKYGEADWMRVAVEVSSNHDSVSCRDRWIQKLKATDYMPWTHDEDLILYKHMMEDIKLWSEMGIKGKHDLAPLKARWPNKSGNSISIRIRHLKRTLGSGVRTHAMFTDPEEIEKMKSKSIEKVNRGCISASGLTSEQYMLQRRGLEQSFSDVQIKQKTREILSLQPTIDSFNPRVNEESYLTALTDSVEKDVKLLLNDPCIVIPPHLVTEVIEEIRDERKKMIRKARRAEKLIDVPAIDRKRVYKVQKLKAVQSDWHAVDERIVRYFREGKLQDTADAHEKAQAEREFVEAIQPDYTSPFVTLPSPEGFPEIQVAADIAGHRTFGLPRLPPNVATLRAYRKLMQLKISLEKISELEVGHQIVPRDFELEERMKSVFLWPTVLRGISPDQPHSDQDDGLTCLCYDKDCKFFVHNCAVTTKASEANTSDQSSSRTFQEQLATILMPQTDRQLEESGTDKLLDTEDSPSSSKENHDDASPFNLSEALQSKKLRFEAVVSTKNVALPADITKILLRELEKKMSQPPKVQDPKELELKKKRMGDTARTRNPERFRSLDPSTIRHIHLRVVEESTDRTKTMGKLSQFGNSSTSNPTPPTEEKHSTIETVLKKQPTAAKALTVSSSAPNPEPVTNKKCSNLQTLFENQPIIAKAHAVNSAIEAVVNEPLSKEKYYYMDPNSPSKLIDAHSDQSGLLKMPVRKFPANKKRARANNTQSTAQNAEKPSNKKARCDQNRINSKLSVSAPVIASSKRKEAPERNVSKATGQLARKCSGVGVLKVKTPQPDTRVEVGNFGDKPNKKHASQSAAIQLCENVDANELTGFKVDVAVNLSKRKRGGKAKHQQPSQALQHKNKLTEKDNDGNVSAMANNPLSKTNKPNKDTNLKNLLGEATIKANLNAVNAAVEAAMAKPLSRERLFFLDPNNPNQLLEKRSEILADGTKAVIKRPFIRKRYAAKGRPALRPDTPMPAASHIDQLTKPCISTSTKTAIVKRSRQRRPSLSQNSGSVENEELTVRKNPRRKAVDTAVYSTPSSEECDAESIDDTDADEDFAPSESKKSRSAC